MPSPHLNDDGSGPGLYSRLGSGTYVPAALPGAPQIYVNPNGFGVGAAPANSDDFISIRRDVAGSSGINVRNLNSGATSDAYVHVFSDVTGFSVRSQSGALGAGINFVADAGNSGLNVIQSANSPINFFTSNVQRLSLTAAGDLSLSVPKATDLISTVSNPSAAANARALHQVVADSAGIKFIAASIATGQGAILQTTGCSTFLIQQLSAAPIQVYVNGSELLRLDSSGSIGFHGVGVGTPRQALAANATDLATVITLANDIKAKLVAKGLAA